MLNPVSIQSRRKPQRTHTHKAPREIDLNIHISRQPDRPVQVSTSTIPLTRGISAEDKDAEAPSHWHHDMSHHFDLTSLPPPDSILPNLDFFSYSRQPDTLPGMSYAERGQGITRGKHFIPPGLPGLSSLPEHEAQYLQEHYAMQHPSIINEGETPLAV